MAPTRRRCAGDPLVTAYLKWLALDGRSTNTTRTYRCTLGRLVSWLNTRGIGLLEATTDDLTEWRESLNVIDASVTIYMTTVRSFYRWASRFGHRSDDPARDVPVPRRLPCLPRPISEDLLEKAIISAPERVRLWLILAGYLGLRAAEIAMVRREHIINANGVRILRVLGKGGKQRLVIISPFVWEEMLAAGLPAKGYLFLRRDGQAGPNRAATVSATANRYLHAIGIDETLHQFRHRFGTRAYDGVRDIRVVQEVMGHASPNTTAGYVAFSSARAQQAVLAVQPAHYQRPAGHRGGRRTDPTTRPRACSGRRHR